MRKLLYILVFLANISLVSAQDSLLFNEFKATLFSAKAELTKDFQMVNTNMEIFKNNLSQPVQNIKHCSISIGEKMFSYNENHDVLFNGLELYVADKQSRILTIYGKETAAKIIKPQIPEFEWSSLKNDSLIKKMTKEFLVFKIHFNSGKIQLAEFYFNHKDNRIEKVKYFFYKTGDDYVHHSILNYKYSAFKSEDFKWTKKDFIKEVDNQIYPSNRFLGYEVINSKNN